MIAATLLATTTLIGRCNSACNYKLHEPRKTTTGAMKYYDQYGTDSWRDRNNGWKWKRMGTKSGYISDRAYE